MIRARGRALPGALAFMAASGMWMVASAPPAAAYVCRFGVDSPGAGSIAGSSTVRFTGPFEVTLGLADRVLEVTFTQSPGEPPPPTVRSGGAVGPTGRYDVPVGPLPLNGRYTARVKAIHAGTAPVLNCDDGLGPERRETEASALVSFGVSVRANPPRNVAARFDAGARTATVTWEPSGDPDVQGYTITRKVGAAAPTGVTVRPNPLSWTDTNLPPGASTITYSVQASRNGPDPGTSSEPSAPVAAAPLAVPAAPAPAPTTSRAGTGGRPPSEGTSTSATVPFVLGRPVPGASPPSGAAPSVPLGDVRFPASTPGAAPDGEGGYRPLIPYPRPGGSGEGSQPIGGDDQAVVGRSSSPGRVGGDGPPGLAYVASGLLSSVVAAHLLWLRKQSLRPEPGVPPGPGQDQLETVTAGDPPPPPPAAPPPGDGASPFAPAEDDGAEGEAAQQPDPRELPPEVPAGSTDQPKPVGSGPRSGAPVEPPAASSRAADEARDAVPDPSRLRPRRGWGRKVATPWVAAEPVEPAATPEPAEAVADEAVAVPAAASTAPADAVPAPLGSAPVADPGAGPPAAPEADPSGDTGATAAEKPATGRPVLILRPKPKRPA